MKPIIVVIKTFERPGKLMDLLVDIDRGRPTGELSVFVFDDGSKADYGDAKQFVEDRRWTWHRSGVNHGKKRAWQWVNTIFTRLKRQTRGAHLLFFFDDDIRLCQRFFVRATEAWESIEDGRKATLNLMVDKTRRNQPCWTGFPPRNHSDGITLTQWVDGSFMCDQRGLDEIGWEIEPIAEARWMRDAGVSTGVGEQISTRLVEKNRNLYQVRKSLVVHTPGISNYNPAARRTNPLETASFVDGEASMKLLVCGHREPVQVSLATIPSRLGTLQKTVESIRRQADVIRVYLNGHERAPDFLCGDPQITIVRSSAHGDRGDAGKFFWCEDAAGYQIICDDDIAYPADYVARMIQAIERYDRKAVVGVHGMKLSEPMVSFYKDRFVQHFRHALTEDSAVHVLGTGCMAYHASSLSVRQEDFEKPNMADVWMALLCQRQRVPMVIIEHKADWITSLPTDGSIYEKYKKDDSEQTAAVKRVDQWQLFRV